MPNPYKARVDVRRFLNLPGFHGGAYVVAYVEDTSGREITKFDPFGYEGGRYVNLQPWIILEIADCSNRISLEFEVDSELVLAGALAEFRAGLVEEACLFSDREPEVDRLNRSEPQPRPSRRRRSRRDGGASAAKG
jgi:hypothetical protein